MEDPAIDCPPANLLNSHWCHLFRSIQNVCNAQDKTYDVNFVFDKVVVLGALEGWGGSKNQKNKRVGRGLLFPR